MVDCRLKSSRFKARVDEMTLNLYICHIDLLVHIAINNHGSPKMGHTSIKLYLSSQGLILSWSLMIMGNAAPLLWKSDHSKTTFPRLGIL